MSAKALARESFDTKADPQVKQLSMKRLIFLSSLYFKIRGIKDPAKNQLIDLNKRFGLAYRENSLKLPAAMSNILWRRTNAKKAFRSYLEDESQLNTLACDLVGHCPEWARYGDQSCLIKDTKAVFSYARSKL